MGILPTSMELKIFEFRTNHRGWGNAGGMASGKQKKWQQRNDDPTIGNSVVVDTVVWFGDQ